MNEYSSGDLMAAILSLQEATAAGFNKTGARFELQDERFERLDAKIDAKIDGLRHEMNRRFDRTDERLDRMDRRFDGIDGRLDRLERRVG